MELAQEDWGVVVIARRAGYTFWIGLSAGDQEEWIAHVHHGSFAWLQRLIPSGKQARRKLIGALEGSLRGAGATSMKWSEERDASLGQPGASSFEG